MKNPNIFIMVSAILSKPVDEDYLIEVNRVLELLCKESDVYLIYSHKPLMKYTSQRSIISMVYTYHKTGQK